LSLAITRGRERAINLLIILVAFAVLFSVRTIGAALLRRQSAFGERFFVGTLIFSHALYAAGSASIAAISLTSPDAFRITVAVVAAALALYETLMAGGMLYVLIAKSEEVSEELSD
jgi:hypothetical protein